MLGGGFDHIYPAEHMSLAKEIAEKGLLLSEFRPKKTATKYNFPLRNRIIAGLGDGVLITEASIKSGTIHTKDFALDYGKEIYSVPGNIDSINSQLTNEIIKCGHAHCVCSSDDILIDYQKKLTPKTEKKEEFLPLFPLSEEEKIIVNLLKSGMKSIDELTNSALIPAKKLNSCLTTLEINGLISRMAGGMIALN